MSRAVYLNDVVRTPRGKGRAGGALADLAPHELVAQLVSALHARTGEARQVDGLLLGCVGQVGAQGGNIALVSKLHAGIRDAASAYTINNYCVSSLTAIGQAARLVSSGEAEHVLAGGVESMSRVPFMADQASYYSDATFPTRTRYVPVALAAERLAQQEKIGREELDAVALRSQQRAAAAEGSPALMCSRIPIKRPNGEIALNRDECIRAETNAAGLSRMTPAFAELARNHAAAPGADVIAPIHTLAHAPPVCDGAGLALLTAGNAHSCRPRAKIRSYAECGGDPHASLLAGFAAMGEALTRAGVRLDDIERIELMEAFAVTLAKFLRDWKVDPDIVNVAGGHLARGHPLGASGAILVSSLLDALEAADATLGLVAASGASGVGAAMVIERT
jgi:acetyl-CoA C-acetyltransferase